MICKYIHLTLLQHGFELHGSLIGGFFSINTVNGIFTFPAPSASEFPASASLAHCVSIVIKYT